MYIVTVCNQLHFKDKESYQNFVEDVENEAIEKLDINNQLVDCSNVSIRAIEKIVDGELESILENKGTTFNYIETKRPTINLNDMLVIDGHRYIVMQRKGVFILCPMDNDWSLIADIDFHSLDQMKEALIKMKLNYSTLINA